MFDVCNMAGKVSDIAILPCPQMSGSEELLSIIKQIHPEWRKDFLLSLEEDNASPEFTEYFNNSLHIQSLFEQTLRLIDRKFIVVLRAHHKKLQED